LRPWYFLAHPLEHSLIERSVDKLKESETKTFKVDALVDELEKNGG
jgi:hypothetical protein